MKIDLVRKISNPEEVKKRAMEYLGKDVEILISSNKNKKYMVYDPINKKMVHFGSFNPPMEDFTFHKDLNRRKNYLSRATKIKGDWKNNKYSPNNLSINLLW